MNKLITCILLIFTINVNASELIGEVIKVNDGDTITLLDANKDQYKVRLSGIDAPEKKQAFGKVSKQSLSDMLAGQVVTVGYNKRDRYARIVGKVIFKGLDANLEQIKRGLAWHYKKYESEQDVDDRSKYAQEEYLAQQSKHGLWLENNPIAPWDFRKKERIMLQ
ncbi:MAG: thermonuclease family protein [Pseudomonadota bacterium]